MTEPTLDVSQHVRRHDTHTPCCSIPEEHAWADPIRCLRDLETWPCAAMIEEGPAPTRQQGASVLREALERLLRFTHALTAADHEAPLRAGANLDDLHAAEAALPLSAPANPLTYNNFAAEIHVPFVPPSAPPGLDVERLGRAIQSHVESLHAYQEPRDCTPQCAHDLAIEYARLEQPDD